MIKKLGISFSCDQNGCTDSATFNGGIITAAEEARKKGWAVCRDRKTCYCPKHASWHRNVGAMYMYGNY